MRGQAPMEFMAFLGLLVLLLAFFTVVSFNKQNELLNMQNPTEAWTICQKASSEINSAVSIGNGYSHDFVLPQYIGSGTDYSINASPYENAVIVNYTGGGGCRLPILTSNVTGSFKKGGVTRIEMINGIVTLTPLP